MICVEFLANDELNKFFTKCKDGHVRVFKVAIEEGGVSISNYDSLANVYMQDNAIIPF